MEEIRCIGGQMTYKLCTAKMQKENEKQYEYYKLIGWLDLINEHHARPKKWLKPTSKGTNVNFEIMQSDEEYDTEIDKVKAHVAALNEKFGTDWKITLGKES